MTIEREAGPDDMAPPAEALPGARRDLGRVHEHTRDPYRCPAVPGTDPPHQGAGLGSTLQGPGTARCGTGGTGARLESSGTADRPYDERAGVRVTGDLTRPEGPPVWPTWLDPR
jgi:hypothetical protein